MREPRTQTLLPPMEMLRNASGSNKGESKPLLEDSTSRKSPPRKAKLLHYHEIPSWQQENEYLLSGYRPTAESTYHCVMSSFECHNESVNIISHILGALLFALLPWHFYHYFYTVIPGTQTIDLVLFTLYFWGVSVCFACSVTCHVVWNHSPAIAAFGNSLDYLGIVLLMWGASLPTIYYGFICDPALRNFYWTVTSSIAMACIITTLQPKFCSPAFRTFRAAMYTALGCSSLLFVTHGLLVHGFAIQERRMALKWMLLMASFNLFGAAAYAVRVPERLFPYKFDIVGASHQIFHVMVIFAGSAHYIGLVQGLREVRHLAPGCTP